MSDNPDRCILCLEDGVPFPKKARRGFSTCSDCNRREKGKKWQQLISPIKRANAALVTTASVIEKAGKDALDAKERAEMLNTVTIRL